MTPEEEVVRAGQAQQVLDSEIFREARNAIKGGIHEQMSRVPMADERMHTRLILALQLWESFERYFDNVLESGKLAEFQIEQEKRKGFFSH